MWIAIKNRTAIQTRIKSKTRRRDRLTLYWSWVMCSLGSDFKGKIVALHLALNQFLNQIAYTNQPVMMQKSQSISIPANRKYDFKSLQINSYADVEPKSVISKANTTRNNKHKFKNNQYFVFSKDKNKPSNL